MSTNWKSTIEKSLAESNVLPEGWDSRETVAEQLNCSEDRVRIYMAPLVKEKKAEVRVFPVWDKDQKRVVQVKAYRSITPPAPRKR